MKTDREQIRKVADALSYECQQSKTCDGCFARGRVCSDYKTAEKLYKAGYRKATEVIDEFVERMKKRLEEFAKRDYEDSVPYYHADCEQIDDLIDDIAEGMRQEV